MNKSILKDNISKLDTGEKKITVVHKDHEKEKKEKIIEKMKNLDMNDIYEKGFLINFNNKKV